MAVPVRTLIEHLDFALTVDPRDTCLRDASIVVEGDRIAAIGPAGEVAAQRQGETYDRVIDGRMLGATPGFVDCHVHLSEMLSRAVFPDLVNTRAWVFHWAKPFYAAVDEEDEYVSAQLCITEMLRAGTTCFLDMGAQNDPGVNLRAMAEMGMRGITGRHAADVQPPELPKGWTQEMADHHFFPDAATALRELRFTVERYGTAPNGGLARVWVNIEGKEPCSLELHVGSRALAEELGVGTTYHLTTSLEEARVSERKHGLWPISRIEAAGGLGPNLVIAHCVAVADHEVETLRRHGTKVAFCPGSALKLAKGAANIGKYPEMVRAGVTVGLGTDGVSASGNMNLMRQMYVVAGMFKDARIDPEAFTAREALRAATIEGAKALLWDHEIGSLEVGKKADLVLFDLDHIEWTPFHDPLQALVFSASSASVRETWVNGTAVYRDGAVQAVDEAALRAESRRRAAAAVRRAGLADEGVPIRTTLYD
jgi:cytosine/adenosine deaminase-related metal-dependent hydrolase